MKIPRALPDRRLGLPRCSASAFALRARSSKRATSNRRARSSAAAVFCFSGV